MEVKFLIEKLKYVTVSGPNNDIDRVIDCYLSKYEIHLENSMQELSTSLSDLSAFQEVNPYKDVLAKGKKYLEYIDTKKIKADPDMDLDDALSFMEEEIFQIDDLNTRINNLKKSLEETREKYNAIHPFVNIDYDTDAILALDHIKFRFGRIPLIHYPKLQDYVENNESSIFIKCDTDEDFVWGVYFVPESEARKIDVTYASLRFERTFIPGYLGGTPDEACEKLEEKIKNLEKHIANQEHEIEKNIIEHKTEIYSSYLRIKRASDNFDVRKMATHTVYNTENYYIICGWINSKDADKLKEETSNDKNVILILEDTNGMDDQTPPTKLKNPKLFKPFEMFTKMYGLPAYGEMDPTIFIGISYSFIFGAMFGDVGQGLVLLLLGFLLYFTKKMNLGYIIGCCGIFSTIFGFMYGSFFGFEDIIKPLWLSPAQAKTKIPIIGELNTVFGVAVIFGMFLILLAMIFHIINAVRNKDILNTFFDTNALSGLIFYGSLTAIVILACTHNPIPAGFILAIMFGVPLLLIALKEPITGLITKEKPHEKTSVGMFITQTFFELFEVVLSYFSNTLSFIRIGAFALSHASMMAVVLMLSNAENSLAHANWFIIILGNIFVMGLEGLVVGIQVLRLEYYEMFSRFYKGSGREFIAFNKGDK